MSVESPSLLEWVLGGTSAGSVILGGQKLLTWIDRRRDKWRKSREEKLQIWADELAERERTLDAGLKDEVAALRAQATVQGEASRAQSEQTMALRLAFELVAAELRTLNPGSHALIRAEQLLTNAFPLPPGPLIPRDMGMQLGQIDEASRKG